MFFRINNEELLGKYQALWTMIEDLKNIELHSSPVYDDIDITTKLRTYGDEIYTKFLGVKMPEDDIEFESFTVISIDSLLVYKNKYYPQVHLDNCAQKIIDKRMINYLDENPFETDESYVLMSRSYKCCTTIELIKAKELTY